MFCSACIGIFGGLWCGICLFCDVFVLFFFVVCAFGVLAYDIVLVFWSFFWHVVHG